VGAKGETFEFAGFSVEPQVLEEIAAIAAAKVEGVTGLAAGMGGRLAKRTVGVTATSSDKAVEIHVHVVVAYGRPLKEVARQVQAGVGQALESMIGGANATVHVFVDGLTFPSEGE